MLSSGPGHRGCFPTPVLFLFSGFFPGCFSARKCLSSALPCQRGAPGFVCALLLFRGWQRARAGRTPQTGSRDNPKRMFPFLLRAGAAPMAPKCPRASPSYLGAHIKGSAGPGPPVSGAGPHIWSSWSCARNQPPARALRSLPAQPQLLPAPGEARSWLCQSRRAFKPAEKWIFLLVTSGNLGFPRGLNLSSLRSDASRISFNFSRAI